MPPATPQPPHSSGGPQRRSNAEHATGAPAASVARAAVPRAESSLSSAQLFAEALDGAISLLHADGGELATLDNARQMLVLRARSNRPRTSLPHGMGLPSRPSQPFASSARVAYPPYASGMRSGLAPSDALEEQSTVLLPAAPTMRTFRPGEGLIGLAWLQGEPVVLRGEEYRARVRGPMPTGIDAPWHLAVPIFRPGSLTSLRPSTEVMGVLAIFIRDPMWSFTARDVEMLTLHADRIARAMNAAELARQSRGQSEMLDILQAAAGVQPDPQALYPRLRDLIRRLIDAPSLAITTYAPQTEEVTFQLAERDKRALSASRVPTAALPPWWGAVRRGQVVCVSTVEERAAHPEYCLLGWGETTPVMSVLAAPMISGNKLLGAIVAGSPVPDAYTPQDTSLFEAIARSAAIVLDHARMTSETTVSLGQSNTQRLHLAALNNAVLTLNDSLDLDATLQSLADHAALLTRATRSAVFLLDDADAPLRFRAVGTRRDDPRPAIEEFILPRTWQRIDELLTSGQFHILDHLDSDWLDEEEPGPFLASQQIRTCLTVPILLNDPKDPDRWIPEGILMVYTPGQHLLKLNPEEIGSLQGLVSHAGVSIRNAKLVESLNKTNDELKDALEKLKELVRVKDDFLLTVSHEFRTPLTTIEGYVTLISRHGQKLDEAKLLQFAAEIRQSFSQLTGMLDTISDAYRADNEPLRVARAPVNARAAAERAIAGLPPEAKARVMLEVPENLWVVADAERLTRMFTNLISNAVKYSPASSPCRITARRATHAALSEAGRLPGDTGNLAEEWLVVGVQDFGPGISPEDQTKLFQKFVRLSHSLTTSVRGTGLGLWICQHYVEAMGGAIWVESALGQGSHFQFCLPVSPAPAGAENSVSPAP